jgi:alkanesulfonate monooxygenase SsuD/methylene tetrahydromethanopterin reductase-like flavin-dependent oxidoreductase (luciferase family)
MLPHYSPLKVAETFSVLAGLFPGRIDLGIGRASGTDPLTTLALQRDRREHAPDDFPQQLAELLAYLEDRLPPDHPVRAPEPDAARAARDARHVAARLVAAVGAVGGRARPPVRVRRTSSTRAAQASRDLPPGLPGLAPAADAGGRRSPRG